jgi:hypothetical protein
MRAPAALAFGACVGATAFAAPRSPGAPPRPIPAAAPSSTVAETLVFLVDRDDDDDAADDATLFGPRRLPVSDCERMLRQSGPKARVPLLAPWPLFERK